VQAVLDTLRGCSGEVSAFVNGVSATQATIAAAYHDDRITFTGGGHTGKKTFSVR
jgi:hypothetical protein